MMDLFHSPLPSSSLRIHIVCGFSKNLSVCAFDEVLSKCLLLPLFTVSCVAKEKSIFAVIPIVHTVPDEHA